MADHLTISERSKNMAAIRSVDTAPEVTVRRVAHSLGYRFRLHRRDLPGNPDLVFPKYRAVVFVHGCFWHQHSAESCRARPPKTKVDYWIPKLQGNVERDRRNVRRLRRLGWRVMTIWECQVGRPDRVVKRLRSFLGD
ncbi:MAG: very short patch repair endonuclease [Acidimicrobiales bacterium]